MSNYETFIGKNNVQLYGDIVSPFKFSHVDGGNDIYTFYVRVDRPRKGSDKIKCKISDELINPNIDMTGQKVHVTGKFQSFNKNNGNGQKSNVILSVGVDGIRFISQSSYPEKCNVVEIEGTLCKKPNYRKTPKGKRICDLLIAHNEDTNKSNYLNAICWEEDAIKMQHKKPGTRIRVTGCINVRPYGEGRYATELNCSEVEVIK